MFQKWSAMEVSIISSETVKPSSLPLDHLKPYKLCLFDQITPMTYVSVIVFYHNTDQNFNANLPQTIAQLKKSLSETLNFFYPYSGRTKDNLYIDDFDAGVTYVEARVSCSLTEFFKLSQTELLNLFVPFPPLRNESEYSVGELPLIGFQVNVFACGGIALGTSFGHKIADAGTISHFLMSWATCCRTSPENILPPNLCNASVVFPPKNPLPPKYRILTDKMWFNQEKLVTRRFVFDANSIAALRDLAKSKLVPKPSRNDALSCFIWKHASAAAATANGGASRASVIVQAVNVRPRMKSQLALNSSIGNIFWWSREATPEVRTVELSELVVTLRESLLSFNEYLERADQGEIGFAAVSEFYEAMEGVLNSSEADFYVFTNWGGFYNEVDFGWGKPIWVGAHGKVGADRFMNVTVFVEEQGGKGIDAFVTLEERQMAVLEKDPNFLAFASLNPGDIPSWAIM